MKYTVRQKFATIREAVIEADSPEKAFEIASKNHGSLFPEDADTYVETEYDAYDENGNLILQPSQEAAA